MTVQRMFPLADAARRTRNRFWLNRLSEMDEAEAKKNKKNARQTATS
jgi:hypothetical protein